MKRISVVTFPPIDMPFKCIMRDRESVSCAIHDLRLIQNYIKTSDEIATMRRNFCVFYTSGHTRISQHVFLQC